MTTAEALDKVIEATGNERYRFLALEHPDPNVRAQYAALVMSRATGEPMVAPTLTARLGMAARAAARYAASGLANVPDEVYAARMATCRLCEHMDGNRCKLCTCNLVLKTRMASEQCPIGKWAEHRVPVKQVGGNG